jgi:hypothetical protein
MLFPYTNVMICDPKFFLREDVALELRRFYANPDSFTDRWGDLPILGFLASKAAGFGGTTFLDTRCKYYHLSHFAFVKGGKIVAN